MDTCQILLHFNILLQQNVTQFSQNLPIHQKCQNDALHDNMNKNIFPLSQVIMLSTVQQIYQQVFDTPVKKH